MKIASAKVSESMKDGATLRIGRGEAILVEERGNRSVVILVLRHAMDSNRVSDRYNDAKKRDLRSAIGGRTAT